jgi:hypothetical protein
MARGAHGHRRYHQGVLEAMEFGLLWRALSRHKAIVAVMVLEFAVTLAILSNALALASARVAVLQTPSGIRESGLIIAAPMGIGPVSNFDTRHTMRCGILLPTSPACNPSA